MVLTDRARLQHLSESHQDFSVIIIDVSSSAVKAQLFGKMLWVMMAVLEDIHLWTCVYAAQATRQTLLHASAQPVGCSRAASIDASR